MSRTGSWWEEPVTVSLRVRTPFRVGAGRGGSTEADLPVLKSHPSPGEKVQALPIVPASALRGLLRNSTERFILSFQIRVGAPEALERLFGSRPPPRGALGEGTREGVLKLSVSSQNLTVLERMHVDTRAAVRLDERYGSVAKGALWEYEYVVGEDRLEVNFDLHFLYSIDRLTAGLLLAGLRLLKYESIGGFGSRGMGLIEEVGIKPEAFSLFAQTGLRDLVR